MGVRGWGAAERRPLRMIADCGYHVGAGPRGASGPTPDPHPPTHERSVVMAQQAAGIADWRQMYRRRLVSAEEAAARIRPGDHLYVPVGQQVGALIRAL